SGDRTGWLGWQDSKRCISNDRHRIRALLDNALTNLATLSATDRSIKACSILANLIIVRLAEVPEPLHVRLACLLKRGNRVTASPQPRQRADSRGQWGKLEQTCDPRNLLRARLPSLL